MNFERMPIEIEAPEEKGYDKLKFNLTESSYQDQSLQSLGLGGPEFLNRLIQLPLSYIDHRGLPELRSLIIQKSQNATLNDVLITPGAAGALFFVACALLDPKQQDEVIVLAPNYGTNLVTPKFLGIKIHQIPFTFENNYSIDIESVASLINKHTKYISITTPHNPSGVVIPPDTILSLVKLCEQHNIYLIIDETYRDMQYNEDDTFWPDVSPKIISVSSLSKTYGSPGIRIGWSICRDQKLNEKLLAVKEQVIICNSYIDEITAFEILNRQSTLLPPIRKDIQHRLLIVQTWMKEMQKLNLLNWVCPQGGVVGYLKINSNHEQKWKDFYDILENKYGTFVGPGRWFYQTDQYFRLGFGWPKMDELQNGLSNITNAVRAINTNSL